jgi:VanZ family protein
VLCVLVVCGLSLAPPTALPPSAFSMWDKAQHALAFVALAVLGLQAYPGRWVRLWLGLLLLGAAIEVAQTVVGWRQGDVADWVADAVGVALGVVLFRALRRWGVLPPATT